MKRRAIIAACLCAVLALGQGMRMTVGQLKAMLRSSIKLQHQDKQIAEYVKKVTLTEKLTERDIEEMMGEGLGPKAAEALQGLVKACREAYAGYEFHRVYHSVNEFCTVDLSAFYLDILKDRLYTLGRRSRERRSSQTALHSIAASLAKLLAPVIPFTADEVWGHLAVGGAREDVASVHLALLPAFDSRQFDGELEARWERLQSLRQTVAVELEKARAAGTIGKSLEAAVTLGGGDAETRAMLKYFEPQLPSLLIVSQVAIALDAGESFSVKVAPASGRKCARCWRWEPSVGGHTAHPELCGRCVTVVEESTKSN